MRVSACRDRQRALALRRPAPLWRRRHAEATPRSSSTAASRRPAMTPPSSRNMRRAPRSTSPAGCPASRSISAIPTCAASPAPPAMSSSTARGRAPRRNRSKRPLSRIPASRVVQVEVGPGDLYGAEYSSKSQVLNIILSAERRDRRQCHRLSRAGCIPARSSPTARLGADQAAAPRPSTCRPAAGNDVNHEEGTDTLDRRRRPASSSSSAASSTATTTSIPIVSGSWALERARQRRSASTPAGRRASSTCARTITSRRPASRRATTR